MQTIHDVPVILRREIEALMIKPFLDAYEAELGHEKTYAIAASVVKAIAMKQGDEYAAIWGGRDMKALDKQRATWGANDALEREISYPDEYTKINTIKKCAYVQMYERIGMKELGYMLSCLRDEEFYTGFNPKMKMTRTKTLMNGDDCCNFCLRFPKE